MHNDVLIEYLVACSEISAELVAKKIDVIKILENRIAGLRDTKKMGYKYYILRVGTIKNREIIPVLCTSMIVN